MSSLIWKNASAVLGVVLLAGACFGQGAGRSVMPELDIPTSALAAAAGLSAGGLVEDASAVMENPARLGSAASSGFAATHVVWVEGLSDSHLDGYLRREGIGVLGVYLRVFMGDFTGTSETYGGDYMGASGGYSYRTVSAGGAWAPDLGMLREMMGVKELRLGLGMGVVRREMVRDVDYGAGLMLGAEAGFEEGYSVYARALNVGVMTGDPLPFRGGMGVTKRMENVLMPADRGVVAAEACLAREDGLGAGLSLEYVIRWLDMETGVRAGYGFVGSDSASSLPSGGILVRLGSVSIELGFVSLGDLGVTEVVTLTFQDRGLQGAR